MNDYIERQAAIDALDKEYRYGIDIDRCGLATALDAIEALPAADVVPVVRCEYCKHHIVSRQGRLYCIHGFEQTLFSALSAVDNPIFEREPDSFCSYGKRREA